MRVVSETALQDLSGGTLFPNLYPQYGDFDTIRSSSDYLVSELSLGSMTEAFLQVSDGASEDVDTFVMDLDAGDTYRIIFSTAETEAFLSNRGMTVYEVGGGYAGLILNDYGNTFTSSGALTTLEFTAAQGGDHLLFVEFYNRNGPVIASYGLTLEKVRDITPWDVSLSRNGAGAKAVIVSGDETISAGTQVTISIVFNTSNITFDEVRMLIPGSMSSYVSSGNGSTTLSVTISALRAATLQGMVEITFSGASHAGSLEVASASVRVGGRSTFIDSSGSISTPGNMVLSGTWGHDRLSGDDGDDRLSGLAGNDTINGGAGNDVMDGGMGVDRMIGGVGNDTYRVDNTADLVVEAANQGTDLVQSSVSHTLRGNVENLTLLGTGALSGTGNALGNLINGNTGNNRLSGLAGNDTINGGAGNDVMDGGMGVDRMIGGVGNDTYRVDNTADLVVEAANQGTDLVQSSVSHTLRGNVENLTLLGTGALSGTGNALGNLINGNGGNNRLSGLAGNDTINGGAGNDVIDGGVGNDLLNGGMGNDRLLGAAGADRMAGGAGADSFVFLFLMDSTVSAAGRDTITDFSRAQGDKMDFSAIDADVRLSGNQAFRYLGDASFTGHAGELSARSLGSGTLISGDVNGDRLADFAVLLDDRMTLGANSFIL